MPWKHNERQERMESDAVCTTRLFEPVPRLTEGTEPEEARVAIGVRLELCTNSKLVGSDLMALSALTGYIVPLKEWSN